MKRELRLHTPIYAQGRARACAVYVRVFDSETEWQREGWKRGIAREPMRQGGNRREKKGEFSCGTSPGDWHTPQNRTNPESSPNLTCRLVQPDPGYPWHYYLRKEVNLCESQRGWMAAATRRVGTDEETRSHRAQAANIKLSIAVCKATPSS